MDRDVLTGRQSSPSARAALLWETTARFRIGVHSDSASLLVLSKLGWLDEALSAEGVLVDWIGYQDGARTADLIAAGEIEIGSPPAAMEWSPSVPAVIAVDSFANGRPLLLVSRVFAERQLRLVATVLQAVEQADTWTLAHACEASDLLARARQCLCDALCSARCRPRPHHSFG